MLPAYGNFLILILICLIHVYWGLGGTWGLQSAVPTLEGGTTLQPGRVVTLITALLFGGMALFYLYKIGRLSIPGSWVPAWLDQYGLWALAGIFLLRAIGDFRYVGFFKRARTSRFARLDTLYYSPLCLLLSANTLLVIFFLSQS